MQQPRPPTIAPERKWLSLADGEASYLEWDGGGRENKGGTLHFAHANGFNAQTYQRLLQPLAGRFRILASDARGHGLSRLPAPPGFAAGWTVYRDDLIALLERLGGGPALLAGHSMGAIASLMVAAARPELVRALVLVEPVFVPPLAPLLRRLRNFRGALGPDLAARAARRRDVFDSTDEMEQSYHGRGVFSRWPDAILHDYVAGGAVLRADGRVQLACAPRIESENFASTPTGIYRLARRLTCPVTLIHGLGPGSTCRPAEAQAFVQRKPDTHVVALKHIGHFLPMQRPQIVREEIKAMADRLGSPSTP